MIVFCLPRLPSSGPLHIKPHQPVSCLLVKHFLYFFKILELSISILLVNYRLDSNIFLIFALLALFSGLIIWIFRIYA